METIRIDRLNVTFSSNQELLDIIHRSISGAHSACSIGYVNAHSVVLSHSDEGLLKALQSFSYIYADGFGIHLASRYLRHRMPGLARNYNATEFNYSLLDYIDHHGFALYLLGTNRSSLKRFREILAVKYPKIFVAGTSDGYLDIDDPGLIDRINRSGADVLMVGMGSPKQEQWLYVNNGNLTIPVRVTVGAFLDFVSGEKRRAPRFLRAVRLEWFFRLLQEPKRLWKRYIIGIPKFIIIVLGKKLKQ